MNLSGLPNALTLFRGLAVVPIVWWLLTEEYVNAFWLTLAAGFSDALDGLLARRFGWVSEWGGVLDPLADKLLMVSVAGTLSWIGAFPWWLLAVIIIRDLVIIGGGTYYHHRVARFEAAPTALSKLNSVLLVTLLLAIMLRLAYPALAGPWERWLLMIVVATTLISGIQYVVLWSLKTRDQRAGATESEPDA